MPERDSTAAAETKATRTPGPWLFGELSHEILSLPSSAPIAAPVDGYDEEQWLVDAEFIVRAANTHADLLKALKDLHRNVDRDLSGYWTESTSNFMQQAEAAIARAEGRS